MKETLVQQLQLAGKEMAFSLYSDGATHEIRTGIVADVINALRLNASCQVVATDLTKHTYVPDRITRSQEILKDIELLQTLLRNAKRDIELIKFDDVKAIDGDQHPTSFRINIRMI